MDDFLARMAELGRLEPGWYDGWGAAFHPPALAWLTSAVCEHFPATLTPLAFPMPEGGVSLDWKIGDHRPSLGIDLGARAGYFHDLNIVTNADQASVVDLDSPAGWRRVADTLREFVAETPSIEPNEQI
jgi:hypothetical protein